MSCAGAGAATRKQPRDIFIVCEESRTARDHEWQNIPGVSTLSCWRWCRSPWQPLSYFSRARPASTAAEHVAAQTACPSREGPDLDHHYCAFVPVKVESGAVHVVELDGTKVCPVDHGPVAGGETFLQGAAAVVQASFMSVEPGSMEFAMMALCTVG